jgi:hypothetical protein
LSYDFLMMPQTVPVALWLTCLVPPTVSVVTAAVLLVGLRRGTRLVPFAQYPRRHDPEGLKFSIRGLMILTFAVALAVSAVQGLRPWESDAPPIFGLFTICAVAGGLIAVWAALGLARPWPRAAVGGTISLALGALFAFAVGPDGWEVYVDFPAVMFLQAAIVFGSLLVVRSCGYRLVRPAESTPEGQPNPSH